MRATWAAYTPGDARLAVAGPKAKLQAVMMTVAQKVPLSWWRSMDRLPVFTRSSRRRRRWRRPSRPFRVGSRALLVFGGWDRIARRGLDAPDGGRSDLEIAEQFQGVDQVTVGEDGSLEILERIEADGNLGFGVRRAAGGAGLGHRQLCPSRATIRRWDGQHARHHARLQRAKARPSPMPASPSPP